MSMMRQAFFPRVATIPIRPTRDNLLRSSDRAHASFTGSAMYPCLTLDEMELEPSRFFVQTPVRISPDIQTHWRRQRRVECG